MKLKFKKQPYQTAAVEAVVDCFEGQPLAAPLTYRVDPGRRSSHPQKQFAAVEEMAGFRNAKLAHGLPLLENIRKVQRRQHLPESAELVTTKVCDTNLDVEMETGTGKTYCYIKTMFELHRRYGWNKYVVVVPSIAIREGVAKAFEITAEHFLEDYHKRARVFVYNSKRLHELESFSADAGLNVMIINVQAFNATGKDNRRIYDELDDFQSRKPIDVLAANRPILVLDEPQKMEGTAKKPSKTHGSFANFKPLFMLRYSATHVRQHNKVHRLDALDAFNQKLVKKIQVRGISPRGLKGSDGYLYLEGIRVSPDKPPQARIELEVKHAKAIKRERLWADKGKDLHTASKGLDQYKGFVVSDIDARTGTVEFANGVSIQSGEATGDVSEATMRRIQIREAIKAHFDKEEKLFERGIKALTLFFIDEVAKYRQYGEDGQETPGEYARVFEEEYEQFLAEALSLYPSEYARYLRGIDTSRTHQGYFSIDKKNRLADPSIKKTGEMKGQSDDVEAYDLILRDKERLLSFEEPTRFIFSHSALREGWDNPNVFTICTLKHSDSDTSRRQEVGRGMRLAVYSRGPMLGERADDPATVHDVNVLTVVASESYESFVKHLQKDISETLSERPRFATVEFFKGKTITTEDGPLEVSEPMANQIYRFLVKHEYVDEDNRVSEDYHDAKREGTLVELPDALKLHAAEVFRLVDSLFTEGQIPTAGNDRRIDTNPVNEANLHRKEFLALWDHINQQAAYTVRFDSDELVDKCIKALDKDLKVPPLQYTIHRGEQKADATVDDLRDGESFKLTETETVSHRGAVDSAVRYDLIEKLAEPTGLTRRTIARILQGVNAATFAQYKANPEGFFAEASRLINEQKGSIIIEHLEYNPIAERYGLDLFVTQKGDLSAAHKANRHVYDYVFTDSDKEREFVTKLDTGTDVVVYAKLPRGFKIPTPVGNYNPDWAIAFEHGKVKHVYFVAETKGSMSSLDLRPSEEAKIQCAERFFARMSTDELRYEKVDSYEKLMAIVAG